MEGRNGRLEGKVALITGAGNGLGYAVTKLFAKEGATVLAVDIDQNALLQWNDVKNVVPVQADITKLGDIERMISTAEDQFGKLDILCNIAGINDLCYPLLETSDERWDNVVNLDLKAPFQICRRAVKGMVDRGGGVILNIGSYAAVRGNHGPSYSAAKHGIVGLTLSIAVGYANKGIRCNVINPGGVNTDIELHSGGKYHQQGMEMLMNCVSKFPVKLFTEPEDIASAALFLCSDESKFVNGAVLAVDGGLSAC